MQRAAINMQKIKKIERVHITGASIGWRWLHSVLAKRWSPPPGSRRRATAVNQTPPPLRLTSGEPAETNQMQIHADSKSWRAQAKCPPPPSSSIETAAHARWEAWAEENNCK